MHYNVVSAKAVIGRAVDSFGIDINSYTYKALEWIGDGIAEIGYNVGLVNKYAKISIENHTLIKPDDYFDLITIIYNGLRLEYGMKPSTGQAGLPPQTNPLYNELVALINARQNSLEYADGEIAIDGCVPCEATQYKLLNTDELDVVDRKIKAGLEGLRTTCGISPTEYFLDSEGNCFKTSIDEGEVVIYYKAYPRDSEGYPLVIDESKYLTALEYVVMERLMRSGVRHPVLTYQEVKADKRLAVARASNEHKKFTSAQMRNFVKNWTNMLFTPQQSGNYYSNG